VLLRPLLAAVLLAPVVSADAADEAPVTAAPAAGSSGASAQGPAQQPASPAQPATPPAPAPKPAQREPDYSGYVALKGGYFWSARQLEGEKPGAAAWELALGWGGRYAGLELSGGQMTAKVNALEIRTIPVLLTLRLQLPVSILAVRIEGGLGAYFNDATRGSFSSSSTVAGYHAGAGLDVYLGRLLLGAEGRYMWLKPTFAELGGVTLDRFALLAVAGLRF
jgi:opacity protein-like surface antigen